LKNGVQGFHKCLKTLDSGFRWNDGKKAFSTFYEAIKLNGMMKTEMGVHIWPLRKSLTKSI